MIHHSSIAKKYYPPLIGTALAAASLFHFALPAFAAGTDAGLPLRNRATATYEDQDPNNPTVYEVISNEVTVTVGKVAGITNVPSGTSSTGAISPGDTVGFDFDVTNTGNDGTDIYLPSVAEIRNYAGNENVTINSIQFSRDGTNFQPATTDSILVEDVAADAVITVRVNVTVDSGLAEGTPISVQLGNTGPDDNSVDTQNQLDEDPAASGDIRERDVRTVAITTANPPTVDVGGDPVNGEREASALNTTNVGANPLAMPRILKTSGGVEPNDGQDLTDDVITYNLQLDVIGSGNIPYAGGFNFTPEDLEGRSYTNISTAGTEIADNSNLILISDAIPANTALNAAVTKPTGSNWTPVYTASDLDVPAEQATWTETLPTGANTAARLAAVTRVGWVYDARPTTAGGNGPITAGTSITATTAGFTFEVVTSGVTATTTTSIYNIAQIFGSTDDKADGTTAGQITFDESGDQNPNNFDDDGTPGPDESVADNNGEFGIADPAADGIDPGNNQGIGVGGEILEVEISPAGEVVSDLLNGPLDSPDALGQLFYPDPPGAADDNHDFQNKSAPTPTIAQNTIDGNGQVNTTTGAASITTFDNTVENNTDIQVRNVILQPVAPNDAALGTNTGAADDLPNGTVVRITYDGNTAEYTYDLPNERFDLTDSTLQSGGADLPITIDPLDGRDQVDYEVEVELPDGTALSTNDGEGGYPVPIVAYVDVGGDRTFAAATDTNYNVTINQAYIGFLKLTKRAAVFRRVDPTDPDSAYKTAPEPDMDFGDPDAGKLPAPGDRIEYQITFENISEPQGGGSRNGILRADDIRIREDGTAAPNNWALDATGGPGSTTAAPVGDGVMDTLHVANSAEIDIAPSTVNNSITYQNAGAAATATSEEVTLYEAYIAEVDPGEDGIFSFQRKVSEESDLPQTP